VDIKFVVSTYLIENK